MRGYLAIAALGLLAACGGLDATRAGMEARQFFGSETYASDDRAEVIGFYSNGCLAGAERLAETGPTWQAMRLSRNRNWGHPSLIDYVQDLSARVARTTTWEGLYIGDMSQPRGGPMRTGHVSHQSGLDVDIWMLPARDLSLSISERESLSSISVRGGRGQQVGGNWTAEHFEVLRMAAQDPRVERIFVTTGVKVWMCRAETGNRDYLRRIRPASGHNYHFHVRLQCPPGDRRCDDQDPPPPGDGCAEAEARFAGVELDPAEPPRIALRPARPAPPGGNRITLDQVPRQCRGLLTAL